MQENRIRLCVYMMITEMDTQKHVLFLSTLNNTLSSAWGLISSYSYSNCTDYTNYQIIKRRVVRYTVLPLYSLLLCKRFMNLEEHFC